MNAEKSPQNILSITIFIIILLLSIEPVINYDIWWHLKTGEIILQNGEIPDKDIFSYTKAGEKWINHEWLSQVIFYLTYKLFGLYGPIILKTFVLMMSFFVIYKRNQLFLKEYYNIFSIMLIVMISSIFWISRPLIFQFLFIPLTLYILDIHDRKQKKIIWTFPLLMLIWVNLHGSFIFGLLLLFFYTINKLLKDINEAANLFKILIISVLASLLNPNTYMILTYPIQYAVESIHSKYIIEWQSPSFTTLSAFEVSLLLSILILALSKNVRSFDLLLIVLFTHLGLFAKRNIALYAIVAVPLIFKYIQILLEDRLSSTMQSEEIRKKINIFSLSFSIAFFFIGTGLFGYNFYINSYKTLKESPVDYSDLPKDATEYLFQNKENLSKMNMLNTYRWGGYLIWRLYPSYRVFIDGRADIYGDFLEEYYKVVSLNPEYKKVLKKYNVSLILIQRDSPLDIYLRTNPSWEQIYSDNLSAIYIKTNNNEGKDEDKL